MPPSRRPPRGATPAGRDLDRLLRAASVGGGGRAPTVPQSAAACASVSAALRSVLAVLLMVQDELLTSNAKLARGQLPVVQWAINGLLNTLNAPAPPPPVSVTVGTATRTGAAVGDTASPAIDATMAYLTPAPRLPISLFTCPVLGTQAAPSLCPRRPRPAHGLRDPRLAAALVAALGPAAVHVRPPMGHHPGLATAALAAAAPRLTVADGPSSELPGLRSLVATKAAAAAQVAGSFARGTLLAAATSKPTPRAALAACALAARPATLRQPPAPTRTAAVAAWHAAAATKYVANREAGARARLAALRGAGDTAEYLRLAAEAKSARLGELLARTDAVLRGFAARLGLEGMPGLGAGQVGAQGSAGLSDVLASVHAATSTWEALAAAMPSELAVQPALMTGGTLRPYQLQGVRWLVGLAEKGVNGILADEMGLGKTVQTIGLFCHLHTQGEGPFLLVVPASLVANWMTELARWAPALRAVAYRGDGADREALWKRRIRPKRAGGPPRADVVVTTYDYAMGRGDAGRLGRLGWRALVVDEGHRLKNAACRLANALAAYHVRTRVLLTGTPLQNNLGELWALLHFLAPGVFGTADEFGAWFDAGIGGPATAGASEAEAEMLSEEEALLVTSRLHAVLRPFMLRRIKENVAGDLPPKVEHTVVVPMSAYQRALAGLATRSLEAGEGVAGRSVNNVVMELRNICNHPFTARLHDPGAEALLAPHPLPAEARAGGKFEALDRILLKLRAGGHKVLIFCTMTRTLDVLEDMMAWRGLPSERLDGATPAPERDAAVTRFNSPAGDSFAFLLSLRAGGVGLNLQAADTVIMLDTDWNPQIDAQAQARAHRIGQTQKVVVLRFLTHNSIEARIAMAASAKKSAADATITGGCFDGTTSAAERRDFLVSLLRGQAAGEAGGGAGGKGEPPSDADLNVLLARSPDEKALYERTDRARAAAEAAAWARGGGAGGAVFERLLGEADAAPLVEAAVQAAVPDVASEPAALGRGKRQRDPAPTQAAPRRVACPLPAPRPPRLDLVPTALPPAPAPSAATAVPSGPLPSSPGAAAPAAPAATLPWRAAAPAVPAAHPPSRAATPAVPAGPTPPARGLALAAHAVATIKGWPPGGLAAPSGGLRVLVSLLPARPAPAAQALAAAALPPALPATSAPPAKRARLMTIPVQEVAAIPSWPPQAPSPLPSRVAVPVRLLLLCPAVPPPRAVPLAALPCWAATAEAQPARREVAVAAAATLPCWTAQAAAATGVAVCVETVTMLPAWA